MADTELDQDELQRRALQGEILGLPSNIAQQTLGIPPASLAGRAMVRGIMQPQPIPKPVPTSQPVNPDVAPPPLNFPPQPPSAATMDPVVMPAGGAPKQSAWLEGQKPGWQQIHNPFLRGLAGVGSTIADIAAPGLSSRIPGTGMHHDFLVHQALGREAAQGQEAEREAQTQEAQARIPLIQAQTKRALEEPTDKGDQLRNAYDEAVMNAVEHGIDPAQSPKVQQLQDALTGLQKQPSVSPTLQPLTPEQAKRLNDTWDRAIDVSKSSIPKGQFTQGMTQADAAKLVSSLNDSIGKGQTQQKIGITVANTGNARSDRSYQFNSREIDTLAKPISDRLERMGRLNDTLAQGNPQADALVAPELLSVMAGGQASGLRMNEAEIARIVGGRSAWENLKATIQHWNTDPSAARSITPEQDKQIRGLVDAVNQRLLAKQQAIDRARTALYQSDDEHEHRRIVSDLNKELTGINEAPSKGGNTTPNAPTPATAAPQGTWNPKTGRYE